MSSDLSTTSSLTNTTNQNMDFLCDELEQMALNAVIPSDDTPEILSQQLERFMQLFQYSRTEAKDTIHKQREDTLRPRVSDALWEEVRGTKEAQGYDREAYDHENFRLRTGIKASKPASDATSADSSYLVIFHGLVDLKGFQLAAALKVPLSQITVSEDEEGRGCCLVETLSKSTLEHRLAATFPDAKTTVIPFRGPAKKELSPWSLYPMLGVDTTMPQYRGLTAPPAQDQYPLWYFFYGTLADREKLASLFRLPVTEISSLVPAKITGGMIKTWGNRYKALVDGSAHAEVEGWAYLVADVEQEDALRAYETDRYQVVRCTINMDETSVQGCSFRFVDPTGLD
ncbi:hypothetical protein M8818_000034 [Zalaria obscura]|uniref:Uncharacterized protein n=1 Tax=Zalaria obscura TaxID=2024903 RepID=A0ACC3SNZ9_9PEZI